jgi:hypothetical protein
MGQSHASTSPVHIKDDAVKPSPSTLMVQTDTRDNIRLASLINTTLYHREVLTYRWPA